jgi:hypothetical protein
MVENVHEGDDKDSLHKHKHHVSPQIPSQTSKVVATNSQETLIPWSRWIQNGQQPMCCV